MMHFKVFTRRGRPDAKSHAIDAAAGGRWCRQIQSRCKVARRKPDTPAGARRRKLLAGLTRFLTAYCETRTGLGLGPGLGPVQNPDSRKTRT